MTLLSATVWGLTVRLMEMYIRDLPLYMAAGYVCGYFLYARRLGFLGGLFWPIYFARPPRFA